MLPHAEHALTRQRVCVQSCLHNSLDTGPSHQASVPESLPLFKFAGTYLPTYSVRDQRAYKLINYTKDLAQRSLHRIVFDFLNDFDNQEKRAEQLCFTFTRRIVYIVPKSRHGYLHLKIIDFVAADAALRRFAVRMAHDEIEDLGQLIQMSSEQVLPYLCNNRAYLARLELRLKQFRFHLGSYAPSWQPKTMRLLKR